MRRDFAYIFLTCSLILILGHSILPHDHVERKHKACEITKAKSLTLSEIIKLALAHDIGANHLEEFNNCQPVECTPRSFEDSLVEFETDFADMVTYTLAVRIYLIREFTFSSKSDGKHQSLRAPPSLS